MQTQLTEAGQFERMLTLTLEESELESAKETAARNISKDMKIKGFRPGKAPRAVVERMVGADRLRSEAIEVALPDAVGDALRDGELAPATTPRVEDMRDLDGGGIEIDVRVTLWPTVDEVPDFTAREVMVELPTVEAEEVDSQIERLRSQFAELEDVSRAADEGDFVMINITALDGTEPIEDASADDLLYEVGSGSFIDGLDDVVMGSSAGDIRKGPGTLPPGFTDHQGEVTLSVLVKGVKGKKLPELTDDWVSDVTELESVDELRDQLEQSIYAMKLNVTGEEYRESLLDAAIDEIDVELPEALVEAEMEAALHNMAHALEAQGLDLGTYLQVSGMDQEAFVADMRERADKTIRSRLLLEGVAARDGITVEEEELSDAIAGIAASRNEAEAEVRAALVQSGQVVALAGDILRRKALNHILEQASPVNAEGEPVDLTPPGFDEDEADQDGSEAADESGEPEAATKAAAAEASTAEYEVSADE